MEKIKLEIVGISNSQTQTGAYALILGEESGTRRLPIIIGGFEAQAIAIELEKMQPSRPLTHDLFRNFAEACQISLKEVVINKFQEGVFFAQLVFTWEKGEKVIDSRTSDAIALAVRFKCPVYTYESVMEVAAINIQEEEEAQMEKEEEKKDPKGGLKQYSINELKQMLNQAVEKEDFEQASLIRDEIRKRPGEQ